VISIIHFFKRVCKDFFLHFLKKKKIWLGQKEILIYFDSFELSIKWSKNLKDDKEAQKDKNSFLAFFLHRLKVRIIGVLFSENFQKIFFESYERIVLFISFEERSILKTFCKKNLLKNHSLHRL